jgi:hypothetical protein
VPACPAHTSPSPNTLPTWSGSRAPNAKRRGQYQKTTLIERYGADANLVDLRLRLAENCPKIAANRMMDLCGVIYPDRIGQ